jgi:phosphate-selective porin OprO/OprP
VRNRVLSSCIGFLFLALPISVLAAEPARTEREEELERIVRQLARRVTELEQGMQPTRTAAPPRDEGLSLRVKKLEEDLQKQEKSGTMRVFWKEGLRLESSEGAFKLKLGGRLMNDWVFWTDEDEDLMAFLEDEFEDGTEFRRARIYAEGEIYDRVKLKAQYDLAGGDADLKDAYIELKKLGPLGSLRVGHFKEPFSLEEQTSSKYITFMERALPNVFSPGRNTGLMVHNHALDQRMTWAAGVFRDVDDYADGEGTGEYAVTARVTALPWYEEKGRSLLHLGASYSIRSPHDDMLRIRQRPEVHMSPRFVDTGTFPADDLDVLGLEAAVVLGPASLQGEYMTANVDSADYDDPEFSGWYVQASCFLTGEHRAYKNSSGAFSRVKPKKNFLEDGGLGAWELAARYSNLNLDDSPVCGGELDTCNLGVNWHLNPNVRAMFDYVMADLEDIGDADAFMMRFQVDF